MKWTARHDGKGGIDLLETDPDSGTVTYHPVKLEDVAELAATLTEAMNKARPIACLGRGKE